MKHLQALRHYLEGHFPRTVRKELRCTCGAGNHVRILFFRVNDQPATALIPEGVELSAAQLREAIGCGRVEPLAETELDSIYADSELGRMQPFENPFGSTVYLDQGLMSSAELVFCPRMFFGPRGQCFRAPTREFLDLTHALVLPLTATWVAEPDDWAV